MLEFDGEMLPQFNAHIDFSLDVKPFRSTMRRIHFAEYGTNIGATYGDDVCVDFYCH